MLIKNSVFKFKNTDDRILIRAKYAQQPFLLKHNEYYLELAMLVEALKVEGWWGKRGQISITSKTPELIELFEFLLNQHDIKTSKILNIKVKLPENWNNANIIKLYEEGKPKKFYLEKNAFSGKKDRIVFWNKLISSKYLLVHGNKKLKFSTNITSKKFDIDIPNGFVYCTVRANNKSFTTFLENILKEKTYSKEIRVNKYLKDAPAKVIASVFGIIIDCEGSIRLSGLTRNVRVRMINQRYLEDWHRLLKKIGIDSRIRKNILTITSYQNFEKLRQMGFKLNHPDKRKRFEKILNNYKKRQVRRNTALDFYLKKLKEAEKEVSARDLANDLKKNKRVVSHYLKKLDKQNLITVNKGKITYLYSAKTAQ